MPWDRTECSLLGRIRITAIDEDRTDDSFIRTDVSDGEMLLGPDGQVAWAVRCPVGRDIRLRAVSFSDGWLSGGLCLLAPAAVRASIVYFGTIHLEMLRAVGSNPERPRVRQLGRQIVDEHDPDMAAFVAQNPQLARRKYYNVLRGSFFEAPAAPTSPSRPAAPG